MKHRTDLLRHLRNYKIRLAVTDRLLYVRNLPRDMRILWNSRLNLHVNIMKIMSQEVNMCL